MGLFDSLYSFFKKDNSSLTIEPLTRDIAKETIENAGFKILNETSSYFTFEAERRIGNFAPDKVKYNLTFDTSETKLFEEMESDQDFNIAFKNNPSQSKIYNEMVLKLNRRNKGRVQLTKMQLNEKSVSVIVYNLNDKLFPEHLKKMVQSINSYYAEYNDNCMRMMMNNMMSGFNKM